jgi:NADP-dependent 3-hydroxy acid dehydrogenase YdfG
MELSKLTEVPLQFDVRDKSRFGTNSLCLEAFFKIDILINNAGNAV